MSSSAPLAVLVLLFWLALAGQRDRRFPRDHFLERARGPVGDVSVAAIVPARNEADVLGASLPSLLAQDHPAFEVFLVDDGSSDGTADVARRIGDSCGGRLRVVTAGEKPVGWAGKVFAQSRGLEEVLAGGAAPRWLLLTDADIRHPPDSVRSLVAKANRGGWDLVSVMARLHAETFFERLLIPPFVYFFHLLYPFREIGRRGVATAAAAGGCVLVRTSALIECGGFAAMSDALIDDVSLGRMVKNAGGQLWLGFDADVASIRPYRGLGELWQMVSRSAFVQLRFNYLAVLGVVAGLAIFFCAPPAMVLHGLVGDGDGRRWDFWRPVRPAAPGRCRPCYCCRTYATIGVLGPTPGYCRSRARCTPA